MAYIYKKNDELYHHGKKGQKWGIRRYQNEDGSLTAAGRKHYGYKAEQKLNSLDDERIEAAYNAKKAHKKARSYELRSFLGKRFGQVKGSKRAEEKAQIYKDQEQTYKNKISDIDKSVKNIVDDLASKNFDIKISGIHKVSQTTAGKAIALSLLTDSGQVNSYLAFGFLSKPNGAKYRVYSNGSGNVKDKR